MTRMRGSEGVALFIYFVAQAWESVSSGVSIDEELELGLVLDRLLERRARRGDRDRAEHAVGVGGREQLDRLVLRPRQPEQVALLARGVLRALAAVRVVGEQVEEVVELLERARQAGRGVGELHGGGPQVAGERARLAHERPDVLRQQRRGLLRERLDGLVGRVQRAGGGPQALGRRAEHVGEALHLAERRWSSGAACSAARPPRRRCSAPRRRTSAARPRTPSRGRRRRRRGWPARR